MHKLRTYPVLALLVFITACSHNTRPDKSDLTPQWQAYRADISQLQHWSIRGRISLSTDEDGGQADILWKQMQKEYDIRLQAPMGAGTTLITGRTDNVSLQTPSGDVYSDTDAEALMMKLKGWPLPLKGLSYWVRGLPSPDSGFRVTAWNEQQLPSVMMQNGWQIEIRKYKSVGTTWLPKKVFLNRQDEEDNIDVRLVVREWGLK